MRSLIALTMALLCSTAQASRLPLELRDLKIIPQINEKVPLDLPFRDEDNRAVKLGGYFEKDKPVILVLAYYRCPMLCSQVLNGLTRAMRGLTGNRGFRVAEKYTVLVVSFDPREKPELAKAKKESYLTDYGFPGAESGWHFLTGQEPEIQRLAKSVGFRYRYDKAKDQYLHDSGIVVLTPKGKVSRYFYGIDFSQRDLYFGLVEASQFQVSQSVKDRAVLLFCYTYDPNTGKYRTSVINIVRIGGLLTLMILGGLLFRLWRSERKKRKAVA